LPPSRSMVAEDIRDLQGRTSHDRRGGEPITADQVYSTERYLFSGALRTVCFLISRKGPDEGCKRAAQGALRESGMQPAVTSSRPTTSAFIRCPLDAYRLTAPECLLRTKCGDSNHTTASQ
jgi:hypothetical protein